MTELQNIERLISENRLDEALEALDRMIEMTPDDDDLLYRRGRVYWRKGDMRLAINDYSAAVAVNPGSPAALALKSAYEVLNFYNKDLYNP